MLTPPPPNAQGVDLLGKNYSHISWESVAAAVPPIRSTGGARAFVGSRGSAVDTTFNDNGEDAVGYGFPPPLSYVFNLTNIQEGGKALKAQGKGYLNRSAMAEGLVGGELPIVVFYYPVIPGSPDLPDGTFGNRYMCPPPPPSTLGSLSSCVLCGRPKHIYPSHQGTPPPPFHPIPS
jgi:hypothetical protein